MNSKDRVGPHSVGSHGPYDFIGQFTLNVSTVLEPGTFILIGVGLLGLVGYLRIRSRST